MGSFKPRKRTANQSRDRFHDSPRFNDQARPRRSEPVRFERQDYGPSFEKNMFAATCAKCGERCEVPFKPTNNKPVYCSDCFRKKDNYKPERSAISKSELDQINEKLDKIMKALDIE